MKYEVHWVHGDEDKVHGVFDSLELAQDSVRIWWKKNNFMPLYIRQWSHGNDTWWDYGCHTMFYIFRKVDN